MKNSSNTLLSKRKMVRQILPWLPTLTEISMLLHPAVTHNPQKALASPGFRAASEQHKAQ